MGFREERVAKNEALHRDMNEEIEASYESHPAEDYMDIVCECGLSECDVFLKVTKVEYERVRGDPRQFVIFRDHLMADVEESVFEDDRFLIVAKREGIPAQVAVQEDPRG